MAYSDIQSDAAEVAARLSLELKARLKIARKLVRKFGTGTSKTVEIGLCVGKLETAKFIVDRIAAKIGADTISFSMHHNSGKFLEQVCIEQ